MQENCQTWRVLKSLVLLRFTHGPTRVSQHRTALTCALPLLKNLCPHKDLSEGDGGDSRSPAVKIPSVWRDTGVAPFPAAGDSRSPGDGEFCLMADRGVSANRLDDS